MMKDWNEVKARLMATKRILYSTRVAVEAEDLAIALERVEEQSLRIYALGKDVDAMDCKRLLADTEARKLRQRVEELEREVKEEAKYRLQNAEYAKELEDKLARVVEALDRADGGRGCFSCVEAHDCRCELDRKISKVCTCGRVELDAAIAAAKGGE